jgi:hypothetical protein
VRREVDALEQDVEDSRARLNESIDRLQDRLSLSGVVDEVVGAVGGGELGPTAERALAFVRRNPLPVLAAAGALGWLLYRLGRERTPGLGRRAAIDDAVPVLNTGQARVYDPDASPRHPGQDLIESRREISARA